MNQLLRQVRYLLKRAGLQPDSRLARIAWFFLGMDVLLLLLRTAFNLFRVPYGGGLGGWIRFLSVTAAILFLALFYRLLKAKLLWRLRNRLVVTYVFIGVIPAILLVAMAFITIYLFAGQFANFVVSSELKARLGSMEAVNSAMADELAAHLRRGEIPTAATLEGLKPKNPDWTSRQVCAWLEGKFQPLCTVEAESVAWFRVPARSTGSYQSLVRDRNKLYLRVSSTTDTNAGKLILVSSEQLDHGLLEKIAADLGEITLYSATASPGGNETLQPTLMAGSLPPAEAMFDSQIAFGAPLLVAEWLSGSQEASAALIRVKTRPSLLYTRLFVSKDFANSVQFLLLLVAIGFAIIELLALWIGTRLTRTVTQAVASLYDATRHINRGDFSRRIPVNSRDQLATLANSFNSMAASLQELIEEQKQKQRLENELAIAQEVQEQLFPRAISQLPTLELHGFCRPARTVSGDYYDFVPIDSNNLVLAVGDVSGKGISAALLMATISSAVRAFSLEGIPILREPVAAGAAMASRDFLSHAMQGVEASTSTMLTLINHQLYASTPAEKYATLFLAVYNEKYRRLTYCNGGHLPPVVLGVDGSIRRLDCGGTVVGLFEQVNYEESSVDLRHGEIFLAYSDGVTEPENDFGEFGEQRLIELVWENRALPLPRISEIVTAAVDDWIGANEQPDDVTLVLARAR